MIRNRDKRMIRRAAIEKKYSLNRPAERSRLSQLAECTPSTHAINEARRYGSITEPTGTGEIKTPFLCWCGSHLFTNGTGAVWCADCSFGQN